MKTDVSYHDYALDNMHGDVELAPNQIEEVEILEKAVKQYIDFMDNLDESLTDRLGYDINMLDELAFQDGDYNDYISDPEYPDREPS